MVLGEPLVVAAGHFHFTHALGPRIAKKKGYLLDEGIPAVEIFETSEDEFTLEKLKNGSIHIGLDLETQFAIEQNAAGEDLQIVGSFIHDLPFIILGREGVDSPEDLRGATIGVLEEGGGIDAAALRIMLRNHGIDPETEVTWETGIEYLEFENQAPYLERGDYDAVTIDYNSVSAETISESPFPLISRWTDIFPDDYPHRVMVTTEEILNEHTDSLRRFFRAAIRGFRLVRDVEKYPEVRTYILERENWAKDIGFDDFDHSRLETHFEGLKHLPRDGGPSHEALAFLIDDMKNTGRLPDEYGVDDVAQLNLMNEAAREIDGRYGDGEYEY